MSGNEGLGAESEGDDLDLEYASDRAAKRRKIAHDDSDESDYVPSGADPESSGVDEGSGPEESDGDAAGPDDADEGASDFDEFAEDLINPVTGLPAKRRRRRRRRLDDGEAPVARGGKRGPRKPVEPSLEFKNLHSAATSAFIDSDYDRAVSLVKQAISINPEIFAAHSLLSEIFLAQGQKEKALAALFTGAHTRPKDPTAWLKVADLVLENAGANRKAALKDVIYCYSRVITLDQTNYEIRFARAAALLELDYKRRAAVEYERLCIDLPNNLEAVRALVPVYIDLGEVEKARNRYEEAISYYLSAPADEVSEFEWSDINIYIELFGYLEEYEQGIAACKFLSRWMLGRQDDTRWDDVTDDDREFDAENAPRRCELDWFVPGLYLPEQYGMGLPLELRVKLGAYRLKMGGESVDEAMSHFSWLDGGGGQEVAPAQVEDYHDLFVEAGDALREAGLHRAALRFYKPVQQLPQCADTNLFLSMAKCHSGLGEMDVAENCYLTVVEYDDNNVEARAGLAKFYDKLGMAEQAVKFASEVIELQCEDTFPQRKGARRSGRLEQLSRILRAKDAEEAATETAVPPLSIRDRIEETETETYEEPVQLPATATLVVPTVMTAAQKRREAALQHAPGTRREQVNYLHTKLLEMTPAMRAGDPVVTEDWLDIADALVRDFRSTRIFFPVQRRAVFSGYTKGAKKGESGKAVQLIDEMQDIMTRRQTGQSETTSDSVIPTDYHGIAFDAWLDVFLEFALVLAGQGHKEEVYSTLSAAADASVWYHSKEATRQIHVCWFTCALRMRDETTLSNTSRWFMKEYQFVTDTYRLFATLSRSCGDPRRSLFHSSPSMKFMLRQIKAIDYTLPNDPFNLTQVRRTRESVFQERAALSTKDDSGNLIPAKSMDVAILLIYGHILYAGLSFTNALNYFFRAYALDPENPAVLLSIGLSYIHHSLKRQSDNRHYLILQGLSFMQEYRKALSTGDVLPKRQEAEFNLARVWHMLGLAHLAIDGYRRCLDIGQGQTQDEAASAKAASTGSEDFTRDAAYALQCLYMFSGDSESARAVTEQYLTI
ncbi:transcription factor TFIIIC subunit tfc4 [Ascosphaera acerosa]|nr:transcription factor TFIIIC subunit tfc4 [Ascosphaera acerosa]